MEANIGPKNPVDADFVTYSIRHLQEFLGHADINTTKTYLRLIPEHLREDYDQAMPPLA